MGPKQDGMNGGTTALGEERSDEIRRDIEHTRSQMDRTLDELDERLQPRNLLNDVLDWFQSSAKSGSGQAAESLQSMGKSLVRQMRDNPVPTLLIGAGLAYLVFSNDEDEDHGRPLRRHTDINPEAMEGSYSGSFVDARTGEPYEAAFAATEEEVYCELDEPENEETSSGMAAKAGALGARAKDIGRGASERARSAASSAQDALSRAAGGVRHAASSAGRSAGRGSQQLSHGVRAGGARVGESLRSGSARQALSPFGI